MRLLCHSIVKDTHTGTMRTRIQLENWFSPERASTRVDGSTIIEVLPISAVYRYVQHLLHLREARACASIDDPGTLLLTWLDASGDRLHQSLLKKEKKNTHTQRNFTLALRQSRKKRKKGKEAKFDDV